MKSFEFNYTVTPKNGDSSFWIDIRNKSYEVEAENMQEAIKEFASKLEDTRGVTISKTAQKKADNMYRDGKDGQPVVVGKVFTGSTDIDFDTCYKKKIVWIWTDIREYKIADELTA